MKRIHVPCATPRKIAASEDKNPQQQPAQPAPKMTYQHVPLVIRIVSKQKMVKYNLFVNA